MPLLDYDMIRRMRAKIDYCRQCLNYTFKNYCRECDEFFLYGHDPNCRDNPHQHEKHAGHRTY